jgi:hypothetical protein
MSICSSLGSIQSSDYSHLIFNIHITEQDEINGGWTVSIINSGDELNAKTGIPTQIHIDEFDYMGGIPFEYYFQNEGTYSIRISYIDPSQVNSLSLFSPNSNKNTKRLVGSLDLRDLEWVGGRIELLNNSNLTEIKQPLFTNRELNYFRAGDCKLQDTLDLSNFKKIGGVFSVSNNNKDVNGIEVEGLNPGGLNNILFDSEIDIDAPPFTSFTAHTCKLTGTLDLSMLHNLGGDFFVGDLNDNNTSAQKSNIGLTQILHTASAHTFSNYNIRRCDITGVHDVSGLKLSGLFYANNNSNLTQILHTFSNGTFTDYRANNCNLTGNHDISMFPNLGGIIILNNNLNLTSVSHTFSNQNISLYNISNCRLQGDLDLSMFPNLEGSINYSVNRIPPTGSTAAGLGDTWGLTSITHTFSNIQINGYYGFQCNLSTLDVSMFPNMGGEFRVNDNKNLTTITHTFSSVTYSFYDAKDCNLTGTHDVSMLTLQTRFQVGINPNLTQIIHTFSNGVINLYQALNCNLTGELDLSMFPNLGADQLQAPSAFGFNVSNNPHLTKIIHTFSNSNFDGYNASGCGLTPSHDLTMFPNLGGVFSIQNNPLLNSIFHTFSSRDFNTYIAFECDLTGNLDISMLPGLGGQFRLENNQNLTSITHTQSNNTFTQYDCAFTSISFVDFTLFPNMTSVNGCQINFLNCGINQSNIDQMLVDIDSISSGGFTGRVINLSGNSTPSAIGLSAISSLVGKGFTVSTS